MRRRSIPFNGLRAFEAAARHLNFATAADELGVTPSAISHQVRALEDQLGEALFVRGHRGVELSPTGRACLRPLRNAFDQIEGVMNTATTYRDSRALTIRVSPCVASRWLMPRLPRFQAMYPDIEISISASSQIFEFREEEVDAIFRLRHGNFEDLQVDRVLTEEVYPVCSPELARHRIESPSDLVNHTLLHDDNLATVDTVPDWSRWLEFAGVRGIDAQRGHRFSQSNAAIEATIVGRGICLGRSALVEDEIQAGRLLRLFDIRYPARHDYCLIYPKESDKKKELMAFRDWVLAEGAEHRLN